MNKVTSVGPGELTLEAKEISPELAKFLEAPEESLEDRVLIHLCTLSRHDRRAWFSRLSRKVGKQRNNALRAKKPVPE